LRPAKRNKAPSTAPNPGEAEQTKKAGLMRRTVRASGKAKFPGPAREGRQIKTPLTTNPTGPKKRAPAGRGFRDAGTFPGNPGKAKKRALRSGAVFAPSPGEDGTGRQPGSWKSTEAGGAKT